MSKNTIIFMVSTGLVLIQPASAQTHETFAQRPGKRLEKVREARERSQQEKEAARNWATDHGLKTRFIDNGRVSELMAIHDGRPVYYTTLNKNAAISTAANLLHDSPPTILPEVM